MPELKESIIYVPSSTFEFEIPYDDLKAGYDENSFKGNSHHITGCEPDDAIK